MQFCIGGLKITNARNIQWKDNGDGTGQLWFDTVVTEKEGHVYNARFHLFRLRLSDPQASLEKNEDGNLWEVAYKVDQF